MFLNYLAGTISLILAVSTFIPWITVWFYSLKGVESIFGIVTLVVGLLGVTLSIFQYLSGKVRGRGFIIFSAVALLSQVLYFRKMAVVGERINEAIRLVVDVLGESVRQKAVQILGEQWTKILTLILQRVGVDSSLSGFDFVGGGLILALGSALTLLVVGIIVETKKPKEE